MRAREASPALDRAYMQHWREANPDKALANAERSKALARAKTRLARLYPNLLAFFLEDELRRASR